MPTNTKNSRTYRPKSGYEGCEVEVLNPLTNDRKTVTSWPYETESSPEMAQLDAHPWITDAPERKANGGAAAGNGEKPVSRMNKSELLDLAKRTGVQATDDMTKAEITEALRESEGSPETGTSGAGGEPSGSRENDDEGGN